jgi:hypothetical protein
VAISSPSEKKQSSGHEVVLHNLTWNNMVAIKSPSEKKKKKKKNLPNLTKFFFFLGGV